MLPPYHSKPTITTPPRLPCDHYDDTKPPPIRKRGGAHYDYLEDNAHCLLLGHKYTMKKIVCPVMPLISMNPMHHSVTMAKNNVFFTMK